MRKKIEKTCPITGVTIISYPEWENIVCNDGYSVSYKIIKENILLGEGVGKATIEGLMKSLGLGSKIIQKYFKNKPFVYIENFSNVVNPTNESRKYYMKHMKNLSEKNMKALIYYNVSSYLRFNIKLAKKLNFLSYPVLVVKDYTEAVNLAQDILKNKKNPFALANKKGHDIIEKPEWNYKDEDLFVKYEVINNKIINVFIKGTIKKEHIMPLFKLREKVMKENYFNENDNYYIAVDFGNFNTTREARKEFIKTSNQFYNKNPFKTYILYNVSSTLKAIITLSSTFLKYPTRIEKDLQSAIDYVENIEKKKKFKLFKRKKKPNKTQEYVDEFLRFIGEIDWEKIGISEKYKKEPSHPFYQIYEAVSVIKSDLDELYLKSKKQEEEKAILEYKLHQSLKLEAIGKLAGAVAHDLNNVLMGIVSYPDYVLKLLPDNKEYEKIRKYINQIKTSGIRAADIVQDLLTLSGKGVKSIKVLNLNNIIEEYINSPEFKSLSKKHPNTKVNIKLDKKLKNILGSKIHLYKTIMNLVKNCFEAIEDKGEINIITKNKKIHNKKIKDYNKTLDGEYIEVTISDNGVGISKQDLPKIFEPFYSKKVMERKGTGLGMMVVKGTVDDHNGAIVVKSKEGQGTEFKMYFPVEKDNFNEQIIQNIDNITGKGELILVVDDEEEQRVIASEILKMLNYNVETVSSGKQAISFIKRKKVDLVLLDMIMKTGISGFETYKRIKEIKPELKTIIVSGYSPNDDVLKAQEMGVKRYIRKPYTIETIGKEVYQILNNS